MLSLIKKNKTIVLDSLIPSLCIFIGFLSIMNHVLWRDEMQGWLVAMKSSTVVDLWKNNAPSGHPVLWSFLIYLVKDITQTPLSMQLMHWALGSFAIGLFWFKSPFLKWQKALFIFGLFPFWEYYIISRHYVISELILFVFCSIYSYRSKSYIPAAICIGLLTNTQALAWALAFACGNTLFIDWISNPDQRKSYLNQKLWKFDLFISLLILTSFSLFGAFSLIQVSEKAGIIASLPFDLHQFLKSLGQILGGYILVIPNSKRWLDLIICGLIAIYLIVSTVSFIRKSKSGISFYLSGILFLFGFNYFLYIGTGARHYGYYYLILIGALWISLIETNSLSIAQSTKEINILKFPSKVFPSIFIICLSIHLVTGIHMTTTGFVKPFSAGKATAQYIQNKGWEDEHIFGSKDNIISTVSGYLDREIYYPEIGKFGSFAEWNERKTISKQEVLPRIKLFFNQYPDVEQLLVILSRDSAFIDLEVGEEIIFEDIKIISEKKFENSWHDSERIFVYWATKLHQ